MITNQYFKDKTFNHVYHLADLHIRNLKRHKEYKSVFNKFLKDVKKQNIKDSLIYIGGDVVHSKTEMSPELIQMVSWFLDECAKLKPTLVITGNHDCNHKNPSRLDALAPIIYNLKNDNLFYLKETGVYEFGNLTFGVFSILDQKENWPKGMDIIGDNKICLFHGPVDKSKTDIGYEVSSRHFTADIFDGYHIGMFGDIHRRQVIQEYNEKNEKPIIVYSSSLLQQNHGELLEKHGYLLWDIEKRTFTEYDIKNEWGYVTIDVNKNEIPKWVYNEIQLNKLPKYPRLRVRFTETDMSDIKLRLAELQSLFSVSEISYTRNDSLHRTHLSGGMGNDDLVNNIKDVQSQNTLISKYLSNNYGVSKNVIHDVCELNEEINKELHSVDSVDSNIVWKPIQFEFSNMFSYGEGNKVDFTKLKGLVGIFAPNAVGKSSLFSALSFCIFDKSERAFKASKILNNRKNKFYCKFHFKINDEDYFIERIATKNKKKTSVKVDVNFWKVSVNGDVVSLNGEQRRETNAIIEKYMGTYEDFILTVLSLQGNNALFIDKSQTERKDILSKFIGVDILDKLYTIAYDRSREISSLVKNFKNENYSERLSEVLSSIREFNKEYTDIKTQANLMGEEGDSYIKKIEQLTEKIIPIVSGINDISLLNKEKEKVISNIKKVNESISILTDKIGDETEEKDKLIVLCNKIKEKGNIEEKYKNFNTLQHDLSTSTHKLDKIDIELNNEHRRLDNHKDYEYDENCEYCVKNSQTIINIRKDADINISRITTEKKDEELHRNIILEKIEKLNNIEELWSNYISLKENISKLEKSIDTQNTTKIENERVIDRLTVELSNVEKNIELYYEHENSIKINSDLKEEINELKSELSVLKDEIKENEQLLLDINAKISSLINEKEFIVNQINKIKKLEENKITLDFYLDAVKRDGLPYELITTTLPFIESAVNNILSQIVDFTMIMSVDDKNINAMLDYDGQQWPLELCSGMERFISGLAIRVALMNICNLPRPQFLVIDEGLGSLDHDNLQSIYMMFDYLKTQFDFIILISHLETSRDIVDNLIDIKKEKGFSNINV